MIIVEKIPGFSDSDRMSLRSGWANLRTERSDEMPGTKREREIRPFSYNEQCPISCHFLRRKVLPLYFASNDLVSKLIEA